MQSTPVIGARLSDQMQSTPVIGAGASEEMQSASKTGAGISTGVTEGVGADHQKENVLPKQSRSPRCLPRMQREERRPAHATRTPFREEMTPLRGREHPAATPSPEATEGIMQRDALRWCMPLHETPCGLFGTPLLDTWAAGRMDTLGPDSGEQGQSAPLRQAGSKSSAQLQDAQADEWACAACTLVNAPDATRCLVCDALKGSTLASAATLALHTRQDARAAPPANSRAGDGGGLHVGAPGGRTAQSSGRQTNITDFIRARP